MTATLPHRAEVIEVLQRDLSTSVEEVWSKDGHVVLTQRHELEVWLDQDEGRTLRLLARWTEMSSGTIGAASRIWDSWELARAADEAAAYSAACAGTGPWPEDAEGAPADGASPARQARERDRMVRLGEAFGPWPERLPAGSKARVRARYNRGLLDEALDSKPIRVPVCPNAMEYTARELGGERDPEDVALVAGAMVLESGGRGTCPRSSGSRCGTRSIGGSRSRPCSSRPTPRSATSGCEDPVRFIN